MKKIILSTVVLTMFSCSTTQMTQKQIKINYELDKLWIDYKYKTDSLHNEFYKKEETLNSNCENCDEID